MMGSGQARRVLIVSCDRVLLQDAVAAFERLGDDVRSADSYQDGRLRLRAQPFDWLVADVQLRDFNGIQLAWLARHLWPQIEVAVLARTVDLVWQREAEHAGAEYLTVPASAEALVEYTRRPAALRRTSLYADAAILGSLSRRTCVTERIGPASRN
jgi:DNA-binding NtrC family response regulator